MKYIFLDFLDVAYLLYAPIVYRLIGWPSALKIILYDLFLINMKFKLKATLQVPFYLKTIIFNNVSKKHFLHTSRYDVIIFLISF